MGATMLDEIREFATLANSIRAMAQEMAGKVVSLAERLESELEPISWSFPVGSDQYPPDQWYIATQHDLTGAKNNGYGHTGIDLNVQVWPRGDVDRGQPVFAVTDSIVFAVHYSTKYLGGVVLQALGNGKLFVRYWHLMDDATFSGLERFRVVQAGELLGHIGNYQQGGGGDHLHLDMAESEFYPHWWFTNHRAVKWVDPVPILKKYLDPDLVDAMLAK